MIDKRALPFDWLVWLSMAGVTALLTLVIWRGDQLQLTLKEISPAPDSTNVSTRTQIQIVFDQPLATLAANVILRLDPPIAGTLLRDGPQLRFIPTTPFDLHTTYRAELIGDLQGQQGGQLREPLVWEFATGGRQVIYTTIDEAGFEHLYITNAQFTAETKVPSSPRQLTTGNFNIWDFSVAQQGGFVLYSALKEDGTSDLWQVQPDADEPRLFVPCPNAVCSGSAWSPEGTLVAYARRNTNDFGAAALSPPRLWLFDPASSESLPVFSDNQTLAFEPSWSADGQWLSFVSPNDGGVGVVHLNSGETHFFPTISGETGSWHPQQSRFLYTLFQQQNTQFVAHVIEIDLEHNTTTNLSGEEALVEDSAPAWSPDGQWIALRRKVLEGPDATPGKQIWRMRADGSEAKALTDDPGADHSAPQWSPDGRYLLFHKLPLRGPEITLSIWTLDAASGESRQIAEPGQRPKWIQ